LNAVDSERAAYDELQCYTLGHADPAFIHQHVVDAWTAQHADAQTKPIALTFALIGLYLHLERGFTGRQVQRAHRALARHKQPWPSFALPRDRGEVTAVQVMTTPPGAERDRAIESWCTAVWMAYQENYSAIAELLARHGIV
jgi:hypothetical protein